MKLNNKVFLLCVMAAVAGSAVAANPDVHVPDELKQWEAWVLEGREYRDCPFIFNLGHGLVPETPPENVGRLVELIKKS